MNYVKSPAKFDEVIPRNQFKLIIDSKALMALVGTEMDYVENELGSEFVFNNPNEKGRCGCGESFHLWGRKSQKYGTLLVSDQYRL